MTARHSDVAVGRRVWVRALRWVGLAAGLVVGLVVLAVAVVLGSVWIEHRYPSGDAARALSPAVQGWLTRPVVTALGHQVEGYLERRSEARLAHARQPLADVLAFFLDERVDLEHRRGLAYRLALTGTPECTAALWNVLRSAPAKHRAAMARLVARAGHPAVESLVRHLLDDPDEAVVKATLKGLGQRLSVGGSALLAEVLRDPQRSAAVRGAAAAALGGVGDETACRALGAALGEVDDEDLTEAVLNGLGQAPFEGVAEVIRPYIEDVSQPSELRIAAVEALANSSAEAVPFLLGVTATDGDEEVRAAAAWAVSAHAAVPNLAPVLVELAEQEPCEDVRRRLYEALLPQRDIPADRLLPLVQAEQDAAARVAGCNAIGRAVALQPASASAIAFDRDLVPELVQIATESDSLNLQMRAVFALRRAQTLAAQNALATLAAQASPQIAAAASHGLRSGSQ